MYVIIVETRIDAEERTGQFPFLERIGRGPAGDPEREPGLEIVEYGNRRAFAMVARPGEIFHARRWWGGDAGGEIWFTVTEHGDVRQISEAEALAGLRPDDSLPAHGAEIPDEAPAGVFCRPATLSGKAIIRGRL